jgi:hypothetical protein
MLSLLQCSKCKATLPLRNYREGEPEACASCGSELKLWIFPAFLKRPEATSAEVLVDETEASCFYHASKRASVACDGCGRFICSLCEIDIEGGRLCPQCIETGKTKGKLSRLEVSRPLYGNIALGLAVLPILTIWGTVLGAPAALYVVIRYWKAPGSLVHPGRKKLIVAGTIAILEILAIAAMIIGFVFYSQV